MSRKVSDTLRDVRSLGAGHFLRCERIVVVNPRVVEFLTTP